MTPERIAELRAEYAGKCSPHRHHCKRGDWAWMTLDILELLDAIEAAQKEIADRELGGGDRFDIGFVEACGLLAARPFDRPTLAAGLIREGGMVAALERTSSDGAGIEILREEMRSDLDALRAQPTKEQTKNTCATSLKATAQACLVGRINNNGC